MHDDARHDLTDLQTPVAINPRWIGSDAPFDIGYDPMANIVTAVVRGFWTCQDADRYFARISALLKAIRRHCANVKVLADKRGSPVQSSDVALRMQRANIDLLKPSDRLAIVVDAGLFQIQLRRLFKHEGTRTFATYAAAMAWLEEQP